MTSSDIYSNENRGSNLISLKDQVRQVPALPGVYIWKNSLGDVLYVGKAINLRARMSQYINGQDEREKIPIMMQYVHSFDYIVVKNETESLVLEKNLIQSYHPPYNVDFRDDKSYPYIAINKADDYPAIKLTREKHKSQVRYFGPYTNSKLAKDTIDILRKIIPICSANCAQYKRMQRNLKRGILPSKDDKACFDFHIQKGLGPCCGAISPQDYRPYVNQVLHFLSGQQKELLDKMKEEMNFKASELDFEAAARIRDNIDTLKNLSFKQNADLANTESLDVFGFYREETISACHVFIIREGKIINSLDFIIDKGLEISNDELASYQLSSYYSSTDSFPKQIVISKEFLPSFTKVFEEFINAKKQNKIDEGMHLSKAQIQIISPIKNKKHDLIKMCEENAQHALNRYKIRNLYEENRIDSALAQLESALALENSPMRIECFDISTLHGNYSVASMVVFTGGRPDKSQYRRFKIRQNFDEANDFAMMSEVFTRRYGPDTIKDKRFGSIPDLIIVDGGKPQLTAALNQLKELNLDIDVCGLAKRDEEIFVKWQNDPIVLPSGSESLYLVKQVRDEAHRFAISFHRQLRDKGMVSSILDEVEGLGEKRKKILLRHFRSIKKLKEASLEEISALNGIPSQVAIDLYAILHSDEIV